MRKIMIILSVAVLCGAGLAQANDDYTRCLELNYQTDEGLAKCADDETARVMEEVNKRYNIVARHKFFSPWNSENRNFANLKAAWLKYRDDFCDLLGYSLIKGNDESGIVKAARCRLQETMRFQKDIELLVKNYQKTLK